LSTALIYRLYGTLHLFYSSRAISVGCTIRHSSFLKSSFYKCQ